MAVRKGPAGRSKGKAPARKASRKKAAPKKAAKKTAAQKATPKKAVSKKRTVKTKVKKAASKAAGKRASKKTARKAATKKKAVTKSSSAKKTKASKTTARKASPKKAPRKPAAKTTPVRKAAVSQPPLAPTRQAARKSSRRTSTNRTPTPRDKPARTVSARTAILNQTSRQRVSAPREAQVSAPSVPRQGDILTPAVLEFLGDLHRQFDGRRLSLLARRHERQARFDAGERPDLLHETRHIRSAQWQVARIPDALRDGLAAIPVLDLEDGLSPTWKNLIDAQLTLGAQATSVRLRGWHLPEAHVRVEGDELSAALFDFGLAAQRQLAAGAAVLVELTKLESHLEARLWSDVLAFAERRLGLARGAMKAVVLIETLPAAYEVEEILHELRDHVVALRFDAVDFCFSRIKRLGEAGNIEAKLTATVAEVCARRGVPVLDLSGQAALPIPSVASVHEAIATSLHYLGGWLGGRGTVGARTAAHAELSRILVWHWLRTGARLDGGVELTAEMVSSAIQSEAGNSGLKTRPEIGELFRDSVTASDCDESLILLAYRRLLRPL